MKLICKHCKTAYRLPENTPEGDRFHFDAMRVVSEPFTADGQVWFWSEKERKLYLNLSCKDKLDMIFLQSGQIVSAKGMIREEDVHVTWICEACGEETEVNERIPCLVNEDTKIKLMQIS